MGDKTIMFVFKGEKCAIKYLYIMQVYCRSEEDGSRTAEQDYYTKCIKTVSKVGKISCEMK